MLYIHFVTDCFFCSVSGSDWKTVLLSRKEKSLGTKSVRWWVSANIGPIPANEVGGSSSIFVGKNKEKKKKDHWKERSLKVEAGVTNAAAQVGKDGSADDKAAGLWVPEGPSAAVGGLCGLHRRVRNRESQTGPPESQTQTSRYTAPDLFFKQEITNWMCD